MSALIGGGEAQHAKLRSVFRLLLLLFRSAEISEQEVRREGKRGIIFRLPSFAVFGGSENILPLWSSSAVNEEQMARLIFFIISPLPCDQGEGFDKAAKENVKKIWANATRDGM